MQQTALKGCMEVNLPSPPPVTAPRHLSEDRTQLEPLSLMLTLLLVMNQGSCRYLASASSRSSAGSHAEVSHGSPPGAQSCGLWQKAEGGQAVTLLQQHP